MPKPIQTFFLNRGRHLGKKLEVCLGGVAENRICVNKILSLFTVYPVCVFACDSVVFMIKSGGF